MVSFVGGEALTAHVMAILSQHPPSASQEGLTGALSDTSN
jgi:hypothetical protein